MTKIHVAYPPPHMRYLVRRADILFTATPCYGIHEAKWVQKTADGEELPPIRIMPDDEWFTNTEIRLTI